MPGESTLGAKMQGQKVCKESTPKTKIQGGQESQGLSSQKRGARLITPWEGDSSFISQAHSETARGIRLQHGMIGPRLGQGRMSRSRLWPRPLEHRTLQPRKTLSGNF